MSSVLEYPKALSAFLERSQSAGRPKQPEFFSPEDRLMERELLPSWVGPKDLLFWCGRIPGYRGTDEDDAEGLSVRTLLIYNILEPLTLHRPNVVVFGEDTVQNWIEFNKILAKNTPWGIVLDLDHLKDLHRLRYFQAHPRTHILVPEYAMDDKLFGLWIIR